MNIGTVTSTSARAITDITAISAQSTSTRGVGQACTSGDTSSVSGPGEMLGKLKGLQQSEPAKFKHVMSEISDKLTEASEAATDSKEKQALAELASKFASAGESGDLSTLAPPAPGGNGGGVSRSGGPPPGGGRGGPPPGGGVDGASGASSSNSTEAADTNADGKVSEPERRAYEAKQAESSGSASSSAAGAYQKAARDGAHAKMHDLMSKVSSIVDAALA